MGVAIESPVSWGAEVILVPGLDPHALRGARVGKLVSRDTCRINQPDFVATVVQAHGPSVSLDRPSFSSSQGDSSDERPCEARPILKPPPAYGDGRRALVPNDDLLPLIVRTRRVWKETLDGDGGDRVNEARLPCNVRRLSLLRPPSRRHRLILDVRIPTAHPTRRDCRSPRERLGYKQAGPRSRTLERRL